MQQLISDANTLIDMEDGQLIKEMFQLPFQFSIPDILFYKELAEQHKYLLKQGPNVVSLSDKAIQYAEKITHKYPRPSRNDCFAIALAQRE